MLSQVKPPFRAEHIGSLLRPTALLQQRAKFARGEIDAATLGKAEDQAIKDALVLQERIGFKFATDGEFRRRSYHSYFYGKLGDIRIDTVGGEEAGAGKPGRRATQPVALIFAGVLHHIPDSDDPAGVVARYLAALAPGSYLVISHATDEPSPEKMAANAQVADNSGTVLIPRGRDAILRMFNGRELVDPGLVLVSYWRPEGGEPGPNADRAWVYGGVAAV